jgi:2-methylcitrate dehydratase PrpD
MAEPLPQEIAGFTTSQALGRFAVVTPTAAIPAAIQHEAKRALVNYAGAALGAWRDPAAADLLAAMRSFSTGAEATVIGSSERLDMMGAAFLNAANANLLEFDDTHMPTIIHPSAPVAPAVFALAERQATSGGDALAAFVFGVEVACRCGVAVSPGHYARGWHITATCGVLGAAAASARLLGLDAASAANAIGIAASLSSGLVENLSAGAKNVHVGASARNGLFAALLAGRGLTAAPTALEGARGWARAMGDAPDGDAFVSGLGERWELVRNAYKAYPCGIVLSPVIDACLALAETRRPAPDAIVDVVVHGSPLLLARANRADVQDDRSAKLSLQHVAAAAFRYGEVGLAAFDQAAVEDPAVAALRRKVRAVADEGLTVDEVRVDILLASGERASEHVSAARGNLARPLTDAELTAKARDLARLGAPGVDAERLFDTLWTIEAQDDAGSIMTLARPVAASPREGRSS